MRVGAVDLGTNSTRLLVADVDQGRIDEVGRSLTITRLGEGVDTRRRLLPVPIARVRNVLSDYRRELERLDAERTLAVGTSAVRDAENGEAFLGEVEWSYGFSTQLLSGDDEARMTWRGVTSGRALDAGTMVVDLGGGSTELITAGGHDSIDLGCVRMTERLGENVGAIEAYVQEVAPDHAVSRAIGVAGTITTLAAVELGGYDRDLVQGHVLTIGVVDELLARLASLPLEERLQVPGLEPERAPVIVAGAAILHALLHRYGLDRIEVSEHDLLHGAALAAAELPAPVEGEAPPGAYTCC